MSDVPTLTDGVVTLRAHDESHVQGCYEQCLDPVSVAWTTIPVPYTLDDARRFVREIMPGGWVTNQEWAFAVEAEDPETGQSRYAGTVSLRNEHELRAEIAYASHPWARGRGLVERALRVLLGWGFEHRDLRTVIWWANEGNWASRKVAWRLGFSADGMVRQWLPQRGELRNAWVGSLTREDERAPRHPWYDVPRIVGERVVLRHHDERDAVRVQEACSDERTAYWLGQLPQPYTLEHAESFLRLREEGMASGSHLHWMIADPGTDVALGTVSLLRRGPGLDLEVGFWAHPDARGRGVMREAVRLACRHAFVALDEGGLGEPRVTAFAAVDNTASRHVLETNGFTRTGTARLAAEVRDGRHDLAAYDLLVEDIALRD